MKVFFTASYCGKKSHQKQYDIIIHTLRHLKAEIISKEIQNYESLISDELINSLPKKKVHYLFMKKAIEICDTAVMEVSTSSFKLGHEATLLLSKDKPLLLLSDNEIYDLNLTHPQCSSKIYSSDQDLKEYITNFINEQDLRSKVRNHPSKTIGELAREFRIRLNLSQLDLECIIDSPAGTISRLENNKINPQKETLHKLASALELSREETMELFGIK
jgi:DNA-binding XRE family transcriptional regulator